MKPINFQAALAGALILTMVAGVLAPEAAQAQRRRLRMGGDSNINRFPLFELDSGALDEEDSPSIGFYRGAIQNFVLFDDDFLANNLESFVTPDRSTSSILEIAANAGVTPAISLLDVFGDLTVRTCCQGEFFNNEVGQRQPFSTSTNGIAQLLAPSEVTEVFQYTVTFPNSDVVIDYFVPNAITGAQSLSGQGIQFTSNDLVNTLTGLEEFSTAKLGDNDTIIGFIASDLPPAADGRIGDDFGVAASMAFEVQDVTTPEPATSTTLLALGGLGLGAAFKRKRRKV